MSHTRSKTTKLFDSETVAINSIKTISLSDKQGASIQVGITEVVPNTSIFLDECVSLACDTITEVDHGYVTGLMGTLSVQIGCPVTSPFTSFLPAFCGVFQCCHGFTCGERGRFTTTCTFPSFCCCVICACTDFYIINVSPAFYRLAGTRALALSNTPLCLTCAGFGCHTFTPNGAIPTGLSTCTNASFIIKVDDCTYKIASSKVNAEAEVALDITALQSPASITFTNGVDCNNGTVTIRYSNGSCTFVTDTSIGLLDTPSIIGPCGLSIIDNSTDMRYSCMQVEVDIENSQWVVDVIINTKD